jgi:hypothetical protein
MQSALYRHKAVSIDGYFIYGVYNMTKRFPVRPKATPPKAVSGEAMTFNMKPILSGNHNKIVPFPTLSHDRTQSSHSQFSCQDIVNGTYQDALNQSGVQKLFHA